MSGLNDGLELDEELAHDAGQALLDDEDALEQPSEPSLQLDAEVAQVDSAANTAQDLDTLAAHIEQTGGMNQSFAMEADALIEGFISPARPLGYFTKLPTRTMYSVSIEAIDEQRKTLLQRILQVIRQAYQRIVAWIQRCLKIFSSAKTKQETQEIQDFFTKNPSETKKDIEAMQRATDDPKRAGERLKQIAKKSNNPKFDSYVADLEERLERMAQRCNNFYSALNNDKRLNLLVTNEEYYHRLLKVFNQLPKLHQLYRITKHQDFEEFVLMKADLPRMERLAEQFRQEVKHAASSLNVDSLKTVVEQLKFEAQGESVEVSPEKYPLVKLFELMQKAFSEFENKAFSRQYEAIHDEIFALDRSIGEWLKQLETQKLDLEQANKRRVAVEVLRELLAQSVAISQILDLVMGFYTARMHPMSWLRKALKRFHNEVKAELRTLDPDTARMVAEYFSMKYDVISKV